ncbi:hypothetical protein BgiBS90_016965, partial [Biomphalaria glabrata]
SVYLSSHDNTNVTCCFVLVVSCTVCVSVCVSVITWPTLMSLAVLSWLSYAFKITLFGVMVRHMRSANNGQRH